MFKLTIASRREFRSTSCRGQSFWRIGNTNLNIKNQRRVLLKYVSIWIFYFLHDTKLFPILVKDCLGQVDGDFCQAWSWHQDQEQRDNIGYTHHGARAGSTKIDKENERISDCTKETRLIESLNFQWSIYFKREKDWPFSGFCLRRSESVRQLHCLRDDR